jgi:hypothetical protein
MDIRNALSKYSAISIVAAGAVICIAGWTILRQAQGVGASSGIKAYFSADDGQTWFTDDVTRPFPFDHDGAPAYRAMVFRCGDTTFCGYLQALPEKTRDALEALPPNWEARYAAMQSDSDQIMVKKPGEKSWVHQGNTRYEQIIKPTCPDGSGQAPVPVNPNL